MSTSCHAERESTEAQHRRDTSSTIVLGTSHAAGLGSAGAGTISLCPAPVDSSTTDRRCLGETCDFATTAGR
jgi:hypothetical protein